MTGDCACQVSKEADRLIRPLVELAEGEGGRRGDGDLHSLLDIGRLDTPP